MEGKGINYVLTNSMKNGITSISDIKALQDNIIVLDNRSNNPNLININQKHKDSRKVRKHKWMTFSTRKFRNENEKIKRESLKYEKFDQISKLWEDYSERIAKNEKAVATMDLHGACVTVTASPDPSLVGVKGRIVKETYGTLLIISDDNKVRQVNKNHTVVELETKNGNFELNLSTLRCHPYLKATKKWKQRSPMPLPY